MSFFFAKEVSQQINRSTGVCKTKKMKRGCVPFLQIPWSGWGELKLYQQTLIHSGCLNINKAIKYRHNLLICFYKTNNSGLIFITICHLFYLSFTVQQPWNCVGETRSLILFTALNFREKPKSSSHSHILFTNRITSLSILQPV
jgi:hypothetical protein